MTSSARIHANRANAQFSTGPKTSSGRTRTARNALRHGLTIPIVSVSSLVEEVEMLARQIVGADATDPLVVLSAREVAEAQLELRRVRLARNQFLINAEINGFYESRAATRGKIALISELMRSEHLEGASSDRILDLLEYRIGKFPEGSEKLALILKKEAKRLAAFDRYEKRALARRKRAVQALDKIRQQNARI